MKAIDNMKLTNDKQADMEINDKTKNKHLVTLAKIKALVLVKTAEEKLWYKVESYIKHDFEDYSLRKNLFSHQV